MGLFEIAADRDRLADAGAVVEHERRHHAVGVHGAVFVAELLPLAGVDLDVRDLDPLLGNENPHPARAGRDRKFVEHHGVSSPLMVAAGQSVFQSTDCS